MLHFSLQLVLLLAFIFLHIFAFILCRYLQFTLRLGSRSTLSSCPAPDQPGEGVLLHYSSDNGITWTLLQHYAYQGFHEPRYLTVCVCVHVMCCACDVFHWDTKTPLTHTFVLLMVCWRCEPLGPIESVSAVYVCNEDKVCWVLAAQDRSQSSSSAWERSTGAIESGTIRHNCLTCGFKCRFLLYQNVCFHNVSWLGLLFPKEHRTSAKKPFIRSSLVPFDPVGAMTAPLFVQNNMKKELVLTKGKGVFMANRVGSKKKK